MTEPVGKDETGDSDRSTRKDGGPGSSTLGFFAVVVRLWAWLTALVRPFPDTDVLTLEEVAAYLRENAPRGPATRAALLRRARPDGWMFRLMYLDDTNEPVADSTTGRPLGREMTARDCDDDLRRLFGDNDMILFD